MVELRFQVNRETAIKLLDMIEEEESDYTDFQYMVDEIRDKLGWHAPRERYYCAVCGISFAFDNADAHSNPAGIGRARELHAFERLGRYRA